MSNETTRRKMIVGIGTGLTVGLAGCGGTEGDPETETEASTATPMETETAMETEEPTPAGSASVRVAHMSPNAPNVDVYVDDEAVLTDVPFSTISSYLSVPAGERQVEITAAGDADTSVFSGPVAVEADTDYTVAAIGELGEDGDEPFEPLVLEDDNSDPGSDTARVRLVHASPDAPAVDVTVEATGDALYDGAAYGDAAYTEVPAGDYTLQVRGDTDSNDGDVVADFDVSLDGGEVYTAFAGGYLSPDDDPSDEAFDLFLAQDTGEMDSGTPDASVRVAHMSPNAPNVDVYVDDEAVLTDVPFSTISSYLSVPAGERQVEITAAGDADTSVFSGPVTVEGGTDYTIAAIGELGEDGDEPFEPLVLEDDNSDPGSDTARVRLVHASPDAPAVDVTLESTGDALYDGAAYGDAAYTTAPGGDYTLQVRGDTDSNDGDVVADFDVSLDGGEVYTAFAGGYLSPDDDPSDEAFDLFLAQDTAGM